MSWKAQQDEIKATRQATKVRIAENAKSAKERGDGVKPSSESRAAFEQMQRHLGYDSGEGPGVWHGGEGYRRDEPIITPPPTQTVPEEPEVAQDFVSAPERIPVPEEPPQYDASDIEAETAESVRKIMAEGEAPNPPIESFTLEPETPPAVTGIPETGPSPLERLMSTLEPEEPKAEPKETPKATPETAPEEPPKTEPPKAEPKAEPKETPKQEPKTEPEKPTMSAEELAQYTARAMYVWAKPNEYGPGIYVLRTLTRTEKGKFFPVPMRSETGDTVTVEADLPHCELEKPDVEELKGYLPMRLVVWAKGHGRDVDILRPLTVAELRRYYDKK